MLSFQIAFCIPRSDDLGAEGDCLSFHKDQGQLKIKTTNPIRRCWALKTSSVFQVYRQDKGRLPAHRKKALKTELIVLDREGLSALARSWLGILGKLDTNGHRDIAALMSILSEDIDYHIPFLDDPVRFVGQDAVRSFMESMQGMFAEITYDVETMYVDVEAQTAMFEMTSSRLVLPDREVYSNRYVFLISARNGLACTIREYLNPWPAQELSRRLKLLPK